MARAGVQWNIPVESYLKIRELASDNLYNLTSDKLYNLASGKFYNLTSGNLYNLNVVTG